MAVTVKYAVSYTAVATGSGPVFPTPALAFAAMWMFSIVLIAGVVLIHNIMLSRRFRSATFYQVDLKKLPSGIPENLRIHTMDSVQSPVLIGLWEPRIYLPTSWSSWSPAQLHAVLSHEIAHNTHRDLWGVVFQTITVAAFGLNPLIWLVHYHVSQLRERRCDEAVIHDTGIRPLDSAHLLYLCLERQSGRFQSMAFGPPFFRSVRNISDRINHILSIPVNQSSASHWKRIPVVITGLLILPLSVQGIDQNITVPADRSFPTIFKPMADSSGVEIDLQWYDDTKTIKLQLTLPDGTHEAVLLTDSWNREIMLDTVRKILVEHGITLAGGDLYKKVDQARIRMISTYKGEGTKRMMKAIDFDYPALADSLKIEMIKRLSK